MSTLPIAERGIAANLLDAIVLDKVENASAKIEFKRVYHQVENPETKQKSFEIVQNKVLMVAEFGNGSSSETILGDQYRFVPNNTIEEIAERIGGAKVKVDHFGMYFFGSVTKDNLTVKVLNSYGGVRAFEMAPTISLDGENIPVFLKLKQIHSGGLESFEFRLKESLEVAKALNESKGEIEDILSEPMSISEREVLEDVLQKSRIPKKITDKYASRMESLNPKEQLKSYKEFILFMVAAVKEYALSKKFSVPLQITTDKIISDVLMTSKAAAKIREATQNIDRASLIDDAKDLIDSEMTRRSVQSSLKF